MDKIIEDCRNMFADGLSNSSICSVDSICSGVNAQVMNGSYSSGVIRFINDLFNISNCLGWHMTIGLIIILVGLLIAAMCKRNCAKVGMAILLLIIGICADSSVCWGIIAVLEFMLILKKTTITDICKALS